MTKFEFFERFKWRFVKTVLMYSTGDNTKYVEYAYVNLYERSWRNQRKYQSDKARLYWPSSMFAKKVAAGIDAWISGGEIPDGMPLINDSPTPPKPRKTKPIQKKSENVIVFPKKRASS